MKPILFLLVMIALSLGISGGHRADAGVYVAGSISTPNAAVSLSYFHDELAPYGRWVDVSPYGSCWSPYDVSDDWRPYWDGTWAYSDYGWAWNSYEPFGWATYHYGRWVFEPYYGWIWIPDTTWGPAWVSWQYNDAWCGWAPLPPSAGWSVSVGFHWSNYGYAVPAQSWCFVPHDRFCDQNVRYACAPVYRNEYLCNHTHDATRWSVRNGKPYNQGFKVSDVEHWTGKRVERQNMADLKPSRRSSRDLANNRFDQGANLSASPMKGKERFNRDQQFNREQRFNQERQARGQARQFNQEQRLNQERQARGQARQFNQEQRSNEERQARGEARQFNQEQRFNQERQARGEARQFNQEQRFNQERQARGEARQFNQEQRLNQERQTRGQARQFDQEQRLNQERQLRGRGQGRRFQDQEQQDRKAQQRSGSTVVDGPRSKQGNDSAETAEAQNGKGHGRGRGH